MYVRSLHIQSAKSAMMNAHKRDGPISQWALANTNARILWAVMTKGHAFDARHVSIKHC